MQNIISKNKLRDGKLRYAEILNATFESPNRKLKARLETLTKNSESFFVNNFHEQQFIAAISRQDARTLPKDFIATLYLFTADSSLWEEAKSEIKYRKFGVNWGEIDTSDITINGYNFLKTAEDFLCGTHYLTFADISNSEIIDDDCFKIIVNSFALKKFGIYAVMAGGKNEK